MQPVQQAAALPDIGGWPTSILRAASQPVFRLSPDEIVAMSFQQVEIYSPPAAEPETRWPTCATGRSRCFTRRAGPAFRLSADEIVAMSFQQIAIYSPAPADPEKLGKRKRERLRRPGASPGGEPDRPIRKWSRPRSRHLCWHTPRQNPPDDAPCLPACSAPDGPDNAPDFALSASGGYTAVKYEARIQKVPEKLALSIARIESNGACGAQSSANAIGVMQIKHATAKMIGYSGTAAGLKNCKTSAKWGVKYLAMCLDLADDDVKKAALCYNQGHGTLTNKRKYGNRVERPEAKGYVAKMKALGWRL